MDLSFSLSELGLPIHTYSDSLNKAIYDKVNDAEEITKFRNKHDDKRVINESHEVSIDMNISFPISEWDSAYDEKDKTDRPYSTVDEDGRIVDQENPS